MKILFLHLSDAHLKNKTFYSDKTIDAQVRALKTQGDFDKCCIMFSGDITYSGQTNEFKKASGYLGKLWKKMTNEFGLEHSISTFVVPGNHDIDFGGKNRNREDICEILNEGVTDEIIAEELTKFKNFYDFAQFYKCFTVNKLVDVRMLRIGDKLVQINLINSELFAVCNDKNKDDDKGKHYLPESEWNRLSRGKNVDLVVTISHRGPEWFEWESANSFKKSLNCHTDLFLYGHEHINDINMSTQKDNNLIKSIARGIDFPGEEVCFTALLVDLGKNTVESTLFKWDAENDVFARYNIEKYTLSKSYSSEYVIQPSNEYIQTVSIDENRKDINDYFVFPGVESLGQEKESEIKDFSEFLSLVTQKQQVIIEGDDASGKTALLTKIYLSLVGNYVPIYLNEKNLVGNNPEKAIKIAFESQYGDKASDYEKFLQVDKSKKVVLIDDLDKIKERYLKPLEEYLLSNFGHIVNIVAPKWDTDAIIDWAKDELDGEGEIVKYRLLPFYTTKRLELIKKLVSVYDDNEININKQANIINNFICDQIKLFTLSPKFIALYVDYCVRENELTTHTNKNAFGRVFESNLINNIRKFASDEDLDEYTVLLEDIAYVVHFEEKYPLKSKELAQIIDKYNEEHMLKVSTQKFCEVMIQAKILVEEDNEFSFYNNNYLAYFVAKSLNTRYQNGESNNELEQIAQNVCFNINGDILLFLSYITSNLKILQFIVKQAEDYMQGWPEFNIDQKNIGFLFKMNCPTIEHLPTAAERKKKDERQEKMEKAATKRDKIEKIALYEYNRSDVETDDYKLGQAIRFLNLVCKILPGFNHRLKRAEKEEIARDIFILPNKIIFKTLRWIDEEFDDIIQVVTKFLKTRNEGITEDKIKAALIRGAETYILNVYDRCARLSITDKTLEIMTLPDEKNTNYKIQKIMMMENLGRFSMFTEEANELYDGTETGLVHSMLKRIIYKHFLYNKNLKLTGNVESVARKYFGESVKKVDFLK